MSGEKTFNRWLVVVGALLIQVSLGAVYIYSVFKPSLGTKFPDWSATTDLTLPSQIIVAFVALSIVFAGRIQDRVGPKKVATAGGILLGLGLILASFAPNLLIFTLCFSVIGGIGIGAAYVCPIATCVKWFPDTRGLITGLAVAGFGAGALVFTPVAKTLIASQGIMPTFLWLAPKLMTVVQKVPYEAMDKGAIVVKQFAAGNFMTSFVISGIMCLLAVGVAWVLKPPVKNA
jgi:OFA family oxalate/formate antiporter-like MFS transporter